MGIVGRESSTPGGIDTPPMAGQVVLVRQVFELERQMTSLLQAKGGSPSLRCVPLCVKTGLENSI